MVLRTSLFLIPLVLYSCSGGDRVAEKEKATESAEPVNGENLFVLHCESCHGMDGKKGLSNAADLSTSKLSDQKIVDVILNGNDKGMMPYKDVLAGKAEAVALADFVKTLRKH